MPPPPADFSVVVERQPDPDIVYEKDPMESEEPAVVDHYWDGGKVPVFKPTMEEFKDFAKYMRRVHPHGMKSGICKIIPPAEWVAANPPLDDKVKSIRVKNPIEQQIAGSNGEYAQVNFIKQRSYNLPQWRTLCEASEHQPPARRGERRMNQKARGQTESAKQQRARRAKKKLEEEQATQTQEVKEEEVDTVMEDILANPPSPKSPKREQDLKTPEPSQFDSKGRQPRARRSTRRSRKVEPEDDGQFEDFDYRLANPEDFTPERCAELERHYWKSLTFNSPLYGADMPGSLFDERTTCWNVAQLPNILDCLGKKIPGVNTAYLYCGMWKSTFAWHLEDVDLYSINYIHFGAPKQWYSISQDDAPRFEAVMKAIWPNEAKKCDQFLRHKTFLVSPSLLQQHGIKVNRLVHYQHEFVITFPYGYHSGYNLGYNCAESVNFATEAWLEYGRIAKKCECIDDAVWVDVREVERKLRGEPTDSESESTDEDEDDDQEKSLGHPLSPPDSLDGPPSKRRRKFDKSGRASIKRGNEPCCLCPNDFRHETLLETEDGLKAHRICAIYTDEVSLKEDEQSGKEVVCNIKNVPKARLNLRCAYCRLTKGSCFQCSEPSCVRPYHATCAALAGVAVQYLDTVSYSEDGIEMFEVKPNFKCKFHRLKRSKDTTAEQLEADSTITSYARSLEKSEIVQAQYLKEFNGGIDIFAGVVLENRTKENMIVLEVIPDGEVVEIEYKWILPGEKRAITAAQSQGPSASTVPYNGPPIMGARFAVGSKLKWAELNNCDLDVAAPIDSVKLSGFYYYLSGNSTLATDRYTGNPHLSVPDPSADFPKKVSRPRIPAPEYTQSSYSFVAPATKTTYPHPSLSNPRPQPLEAPRAKSPTVTYSAPAPTYQPQYYAYYYQPQPPASQPQYIPPSQHNQQQLPNPRQQQPQQQNQAPPHKIQTPFPTDSMVNFEHYPRWMVGNGLQGGEIGHGSGRGIISQQSYPHYQQQQQQPPHQYHQHHQPQSVPVPVSNSPPAHMTLPPPTTAPSMRSAYLPPPNIAPQIRPPMAESFLAQYGKAGTTITLPPPNIHQPQHHQQLPNPFSAHSSTTFPKLELAKTPT